MEQENKFNEAEIVVGVCFMLFIDILAIIIDATGVGLIIAPFLQSSANVVSGFWLRAKGDASALKAGRLLGKMATNAIPLLPTNTIVFSMEVFLHNHPKAGKLVGPSIIKGTK